MQRNSNENSHIPFFLDNNLFAATARYLSLADIAALAQTCQRGDELKRIVWFDASKLENPVAVLRALSSCTRRQVAQFFRQYRDRLEPIIAGLIKDENNHAAYALHLLMCRVNKNNVNKWRTLQAFVYLTKENHSKHLIQSVKFIYDVIYKHDMNYVGLFKYDFYINLRGIKFNDTDRFDSIKFDFADMRDADLTDKSLIRCKLRGVELQNAKLSFTQFSHSNMTGANFSGAAFDITEILYENSELNEVTFFIRCGENADNKACEAILQKNKELMTFYHNMNIANPYVVMAMARDYVYGVRFFPAELHGSYLKVVFEHPLFAAHQDFIKQITESFACSDDTHIARFGN